VTNDDLLYRHRLLVFARAAEEGVSQACRALGYNRSWFYRWKGRVERKGLEVLRPSPPNYVSGWACRIGRRSFQWPAAAGHAHPLYSIESDLSAVVASRMTPPLALTSDGAIDVGHDSRDWSGHLRHFRVKDGAGFAVRTKLRRDPDQRGCGTNHGLVRQIPAEPSRRSPRGSAGSEQRFAIHGGVDLLLERPHQRQASRAAGLWSQVDADCSVGEGFQINGRAAIRHPRDRFVLPPRCGDVTDARVLGPY